jgi:DNA-binding CsgD family transcriptional regulator
LALYAEIIILTEDRPLVSGAALDEFLWQLDTLAVETGTHDVIWALSAAFFADNGFDRVIHVRAKRGLVQSRATLGPEWSDLYAARDASLYDPFLSICCLTFNPIPTGIDYLPRHEMLAPDQRHLICVAADFGLRAGFSTTTQVSRKGHASGWNLGSTLAAREVDALRRDREAALRLAAKHACEALSRHEVPQTRPLLSARETECLGHAAAGLRTKQIAHKLGVTPGAVDLYLRNARIKLRATTREQAVAVGLTEGYIEV